MPEAVAKTKKATNILRPAIDVTFYKDAESEVFSDSRRFFYDFFLEKVALYPRLNWKMPRCECLDQVDEQEPRFCSPLL